MIESDNITSIVIVIFFLVSFILIFTKTSRRLRKGGGSLTTFMLGTMDAFYNRDKKKAADEIVEQKADKKLNDQDTDKLKD